MLNLFKKKPTKADELKEEMMDEKKEMTRQLREINQKLERVIKDGKVQSETVIKNIHQVIEESSK